MLYITVSWEMLSKKSDGNGSELLYVRRVTVISSVSSCYVFLTSFRHAVMSLTQEETADVGRYVLSRQQQLTEGQETVVSSSEKRREKNSS